MSHYVFRLFTFLILGALAIVIVLTSSAQAGGLVRIMCLGDSITYGTGSSDDAGYRRELCLSLARYAVDFVGSLQTGPSDFDNDHEGHSRWTANQVAKRVYVWLVDNPADLVLLHIGTNDINGGQDAAGVAAEVEQILINIDKYDTEITVFLARIINRRDPSTQEGLTTTAYNNTIQTMADIRIANGDKIIVVDQESALTYPDDMHDEVHPNDAGYAKVAALWFKVLGDSGLLPVSDRPHGVISYWHLDEAGSPHEEF